MHLDAIVDDSDLNVRNYVVDFTRLLSMQSLEVDNMIRNADLKAQLMLGINAILMATLTNTPFSSFTDPLVSSTEPGSLIQLLLQAGIFLALVLSVFYALWTVIPRFHPSASARSMYFFGDIIRMNEQDYVNRYLEMSLDEVKESIIAQIHAKSFVVNTKFRKVRMSILFMGGGIVLWGLLNILPLT